MKNEENNYINNDHSIDSNITKILDLTYNIHTFTKNVDIKKSHVVYKKTFDDVNTLSKNLERNDKLNIRIKQGNKYINLYDFLLKDSDINNIDNNDLEKKLKIILSTVAYFHSMNKQEVLENLMFVYSYYKYQGDCVLNNKKSIISGITTLSKDSTSGIRLSNFNTFKKSDLNISFRSYLIGLLLALQLKGDMYEIKEGKVLSSECFNLLKELLQKYNKDIKPTKKDFENNNSFLQKYLSEDIPIVDIMVYLEDKIKKEQLDKFVDNTKNTILQKVA